VLVTSDESKTLAATTHSDKNSSSPRRKKRVGMKFLVGCKTLSTIDTEQGNKNKNLHQKILRERAAALP
jgi:hypothetical protein